MLWYTAGTLLQRYPDPANTDPNDYGYELNEHGLNFLYQKFIAGLARQEDMPALSSCKKCNRRLANAKLFDGSDIDFVTTISLIHVRIPTSYNNTDLR